jgi:hypothetical protein
MSEVLVVVPEVIAEGRLDATTDFRDQLEASVAALAAGLGIDWRSSVLVQPSQQASSIEILHGGAQWSVLASDVAVALARQLPAEVDGGLDLAQPVEDGSRLSQPQFLDLDPAGAGRVVGDVVAQAVARSPGRLLTDNQISSWGDQARRSGLPRLAALGGELVPHLLDRGLRVPPPEDLAMFESEELDLEAALEWSHALLHSNTVRVRLCPQEPLDDERAARADLAAAAEASAFEALNFAPPRMEVTFYAAPHPDLVSIEFDALTCPVLTGVGTSTDDERIATALVEVVRDRPESFFGIRQALSLLGQASYVETLLTRRALELGGPIAVTQCLRRQLEKQGSLRALMPTLERLVLQGI